VPDSRHAADREIRLFVDVCLFVICLIDWLYQTENTSALVFASALKGFHALGSAVQRIDPAILLR
jgi:hypothetical protein